MRGDHPIATIETEPRDHRGPHAIAIACLVIAAISLVVAAVLYSSYRATISREETNLHNLSKAFAAETRYATRALELIVAASERAYLHAPRDREQDGAGDYLAYADGSTENLLGVYLYDPAGHLVARRVANAAVRPPPVPSGPPAHLRIGVSTDGHGGGPATINLSRAVFDAAGRHIGTLVAQSDAAYFQRIFSASDLGKGGSITLLHLDGTMLARGPTLPGVIGRSFRRTELFQRYLPAAPHGAFEAVSPTDGMRRLYGYSSVDDYPLVIIAGRDKSDTLKTWYEWLWTGAVFWLLMSLTLLFIAARVRREAARQAALIGRLAASEARLTHGSRYLKAIIDALATPLWVLDAERRILMFNNAFSRFTGKMHAELAGRPEAEALDGKGAQVREQLYQDVLGGAGMKSIETEVKDGQGRARTVIQLAARLESDADAAQIVNTLTDISERKQVELRLAYLAEFDPLTGLPNQNQLRRVLLEAVTEARPKGERMALVIVALERLHEVIDLLGHEAGDEAVEQVGAALRALAPPCLCIARMKHNEFALLLPMVAGGQSVDEFSLALEHLLAGPLTVHNREFYLGPLVGIALYPQDATSVHELLRLADIAKHRAGAEGSEPIHFYSERTHTLLNERLTIEEQLRRALDRGELRVVYQPKVDSASGRIAGFEALLRWSNPVLGDIGPAIFVPIAESTGLIVPIGAWVLHTACTHAGGWGRELDAPVKVAVNLSMRQCYQKDLIPTVRRTLAETGIEPSALELEITESIAMSRADAVDRLFNGIRELGVDLSIDDFGTGYSSLAYLKRFPVQRLKVDRAFVRDLGHDADSAAIIRSIVTLGHGLQMRIVAEGVETAAQLALLRELECDEYQGFLFSRPVEAHEVPALLRANWARPPGG